MSDLDTMTSILQIIPRLGSGGAEKTTLDIARAIVENQWASIVVSEGGRLVESIEKQGSTHIMMSAASKNPFKILFNAWRLVSIIRQKNISIIHARSRAPAWSALLASRICGIPFVTTYHGAYKQSSKIKALYNSVMVRSSITIANSNWTSKLIRSRYPNRDLNIQTVYRGTDFNEFDKAAISRARKQALWDIWSVDEDQPIILSLARITELKGQRTLIETIPAILGSNPDAVIVFAGDDQGHSGYRQELEKRCAELGVSQNVRFPGHCEDPAAAFSISLVTVVSSHQPETFGRVAVEAQALGSLVVVSDLGGAGETVLSPPVIEESQRTGWKIPANDAPAMQDAIVEVLQIEAAARQRIIQNARAHVVEKFSTQRMCSETIKIYESLIRDR